MAKALELFRANGIKSTTMQQVAEASGVSKGALYLNFSSKSDLTIAAMEYLNEELVAEVNQLLEREDLSPRAQLVEQIRLQFNSVREDQNLTTEFWQEAGLQFDETMILMAEKIRMTWQLIQEKFLVRAYGDRIKTYSIDLSVILSGTLNEYSSLALLENIELQVNEAADFLVYTMDCLVEGLERDQPEPFLNESLFTRRGEVAAKLAEAVKKRLADAFEEIKAFFDAMELEDREEVDVQSVLDLLGRELDAEEPNRMLVQGLLANFREWKAIQDPRRRIADVLKIKLL
nr:helix-turn-helix domain containing protein [Acanthopleuribacter pedis]